MSPKSLKVGDEVLIASSLSKTYRARYLGRDDMGQPYYAFVVPDFAGQDGPEDRGLCHLKAADVRKMVSPAEAAA
jgi:hypothetical protein